MFRYILLWYYSLKEVFMYTYVLFLQNIRVLVVIFVVSALLQFGATGQWVTEVWWVSTTMIIWYVFITEIVMTQRRDAAMIREIQSWSIIFYLNKPIHFLGYYFSRTFVRTLLMITIIWWCSWLIIFAFVQTFPRYGLIWAWLFLISLFIGVWLLSLIGLLMWLAAFQLEDSRFLRLMIGKLYLLFGGVFFPIDIYPQWLQSVSELLPFQYYIYGPAKFFTTGDFSFFVKYFPIQMVWFMVLSWVVVVMYRSLVKKLEINGG